MKAEHPGCIIVLMLLLADTVQALLIGASYT